MEHGLYPDADNTARMLLEELGELNRELVAPPKEPRDEKPAPPQPRRALLVEDNPNERKLLAGFLKMAGFEVETAGDGEDALEYLKSHQLPDVILLDMLMPRCDGPTAVSRIRRDPALASTKIFVVSGSAPGNFGLETGPGGIDRWFNKPIDPEQLAREMARDLMTTHQVA
jgi:CheY-like chemotaxis protein